MKYCLTRLIPLLTVCMTLLVPVVQAQEPAGGVPAYAVRRVYLGEFQGHREEVSVLQNLLTNALLEEGFAVVQSPDEADFLVTADMGFQDVWGEYTKSRNYRVYSTLQVSNPGGEDLWQQSFTKKPRCSRKCFRKIAEKTAEEFRRKAGAPKGQLSVPSQPSQISPLAPLVDQ